MDITTYKQLKEKHEDAILLFRVGDFYETYDGDASVTSAILAITLTHNTEDDINMAGFPCNMLDTYLPKLIKAGKRVAFVNKSDKTESTQEEQKMPANIIKTPKEESSQEKKSTNVVKSLKEENKKLKERITELAKERDKAMAEAQESVCELCRQLIMINWLPEEAEQIIYTYIDVKDAVRLKLENSITPSLNEVKTLLDRIEKLEKED